MEMKIDSNKIVSERKKRAWSQQHLADVSALSLRTIQRVEKNDSGSLETVKALASCFELDVSTLFNSQNNCAKESSKLKAKIAMISPIIIAIFCSIFFITPASMAKDITITAEGVEKNINDGYITYTQNVEIFFSKDIPYEVLIDSNWQSNTSSLSSGTVKIHLESSTIFIENASIEELDNGTRITADFAKSSAS